jgi:hypothetical protein
MRHVLVGLAKIILFKVHAIFIAGKSPCIRSYTVQMYGSGHPYVLGLNKSLAFKPVPPMAFNRMEFCRLTLAAALKAGALPEEERWHVLRGVLQV